MSQDPKLAARPRTKLGTAESRRLRRQNLIPGNVFGHGEPPLPVTVPDDQISPVIHSGHKVVDLELNGTMQKALLRDAQWDTFGINLLHFDLQRVSADERIETEVAIEIHGSAPGVAAGGILEIVLHTVPIECPATEIPEHFELNVNHLELEHAIRVKDLEVPPGVKVLLDPEDIVLHVVHPVVVEEVDEEAASRGPMEPELVGKDDDEAEGE